MSKKNCWFCTAPSTAYPWRQKMRGDEPRVWFGMADPPMPQEKTDISLGIGITFSSVGPVTGHSKHRLIYKPHTFLSQQDLLKLVISDLCRKDPEVSWPYCKSPFRVTRQIISLHTAHLLALPPGNFNFTKVIWEKTCGIFKMRDHVNDRIHSVGRDY